MKNILITWHNPEFGVASLKYLLDSFSTLAKLPEKIKLNKEIAMESVFENKKKKGFAFDEILYLTYDNAALNHSIATSKLPLDFLNSHQDFLENGLHETYEILKVKKIILTDDTIEHPKVKEIFDKKLNQKRFRAWNHISNGGADQQIKWLNAHTNFKESYPKKIQVAELKVTDLNNEEELCNILNQWIDKTDIHTEKCNYFIDISAGTTETQVAWHVLSQAGKFPMNTRFIKSNFTQVISNINCSIVEVPANLFSNLSATFPLFKEPSSVSRKLVNKKMNAFLSTGFSILLLGERGIGKSRIAAEAKKSLGYKGIFMEANCASFDEDSKAEAELFGYAEGAFTGAARKGKKGLLEEADGGILFLDEIHLLSKLVQGKLMKALQTDENNRMSIRKMGSNNEIKIESRLIFASNKTISELRTALLPDFYDRIVQHVIHIPSLRETKEDRFTDWESIWKSLKFSGIPPVPNEANILRWLNGLPLFGNFRDLQKIAMYYNAFNNFDIETREMISQKNAFEYAKSEFSKYHSILSENIPDQTNFNSKLTTKEMQANFLFGLQEWAVKKFGGRKPAIEHFRELGETITEKTFNDWKNKKSLSSLKNQ